MVSPTGPRSICQHRRVVGNRLSFLIFWRLLLLIVVVVVVGVVMGSAVPEPEEHASCGVSNGDDENHNHNNEGTCASSEQQQPQRDNNSDDEDCKDDNQKCPAWASAGECAANPAYMLASCRASCGVCGDDGGASPRLDPGLVSSSAATATTTTTTTTADGSSACADAMASCAAWAADGECDANPRFMLSSCARSCYACSEKNDDDDHDDDGPEDASDLGVPQELHLPPGNAGAAAESPRERIRRMRRHVSETNSVCENRHAECTVRAALGDCGTDSAMKKECGPACFSCEYVAFERDECPMDDDLSSTNAWKQPGDLDATFRRMSSEPFRTKYGVEILSEPPGGPWILTMEGVTTPEEAAILIELGAKRGYASSRGVVTVDRSTIESQVVADRTSTNAWCLLECEHNQTAREVAHRLAEITGLPAQNAEQLQLLRYEPGQFYKSHHDYINFHRYRQQGPRILTFYLYLNDVEEGGGTHFDHPNLTVTPKAGRAVVWPSVLDGHPDRRDPATAHQALPVEKGVKFGANAWFHLRDYKTPSATLCATSYGPLEGLVGWYRRRVGPETRLWLTEG